MKPGVFIMSGVNSETINTYIQDRPLIDVPMRKVEWKGGYGVDGNIPFDEEAYENTEMELVMVTNGKDLIGDRQDLVNLIDTRGIYRDFIPYFDPHKIYRVMLNDKVQFENKYYYGTAQTSSIKFTVKPYKYLIDSPTKKVNGKTTTIINPTNYISQPIIRIEGSGDVELKIGSESFKMLDIPSKIVLDSERYVAYTEGATGRPLESMNSKITTREYPLLKPGLNNIKAIGNVTSIEIEPRWRSLV